MIRAAVATTGSARLTTLAPPKIIPKLPKSSKSPKPKKPSPPLSMSDYLIKKLSFAPDDAARIAAKYLSSVTSTAAPDSVVSFLTSEAGLSPPQLHRFVRTRPSILTFKVSSNLSPKLHLLRSLLPPDSPPSLLPSLVSSCASSFGYSASGRLSPSLSYLLSLLNDDKPKLISALLRCPRLLTYPISTLTRNADLLISLGLPRTHLPLLVHSSPVVLILSPLRLRSVFSLLSLHLGPDSLSSAPAVAVAASLSEPDFVSKLNIIKSSGFDIEQILMLLRRSPNFMRLKEETMVRKLEFFVRQLGMGPGEILKNTWVVMFSMQARVLPRYNLARGLRDRGLVEEEVDMRKAFLLKESDFVKEFVDKFRSLEESKDLVEEYLRSSTAKKMAAAADDEGK